MALAQIAVVLILGRAHGYRALVDCFPAAGYLAGITTSVVLSKVGNAANDGRAVRFAVAGIGVVAMVAL